MKTTMFACHCRLGITKARSSTLFFEAIKRDAIVGHV
jgi:hypothetical protein